ncbi:MFS transporter [Aquipuribacter nitratireducens]|uniref:MFS transporter n=1 Tax=Aquipuribacter nitratireducens TaxID=650104 RepID=A0ABW0GNM1_9MICO
MTPEAPVPLWALPGVRRLVGVTLAGMVGFAATLAALPWWAVQGGASLAQAGLVTTAMLTATVVTQALVPAVVRRLGNGRTLALGLVALGAPAPLYALTDDLLPLLVVSAVRGTGFAALTVVGSTLTWTLAPRGRHGETAGLYGLAVGLASVVVVPGAVALAQNVAFWPVALVAAAPLLGVRAALRMARDERADATAPVGSGPRGLAHHGRAVTAALVPSAVLLVVTLAGAGLMTFLPIERPAGVLAPVALLLFGATTAVARWRAGLLADRLGTRLLLPASAVVGALGLAGVGGALLLGDGWRAGALVLVAAFVCGVGYGAVQNLTLVAAFARVDGADTPTASAVWNLCFDGGTALGATLVGALAGASVGWSLAGAGTSESVGVPAALVVCACLVVLVAPLGAQRPQPSGRPAHASR